MQMSTLSFQDYVRQRMLKRREQELAAQREPAPAAALANSASPGAAPLTTPAAPPAGPRALSVRAAVQAAAQAQLQAQPQAPVAKLASGVAAAAPRAAELARAASKPDAASRQDFSLAQPTALAEGAEELLAAVPRHALHPATPIQVGPDLLNELREVKGLIETRFGALAFLEKLQREPRQAQLTQRLLDAGFSPALARKLVVGLPAEGDENAWATEVLARNLPGAEAESALEDRSGIFALVGPTGVGKTTSTAKLAAAFAAKYGASQLGLITLDAYRVGAQEQLRTYGRILGVPVHTAHDRASLEDLLELLSAKRLVLIDTAGMAQRDARTRELLDMLSHRAIQRLLVINAAAQGETIEDVILSYRAATSAGIVLSKMDEAVKLGPALDAAIRHKLRVLAVANGQRVPEDWHRLSALALVQRALRPTVASAWRLDEAEVSLLFTTLPQAALASPMQHTA
jgi:flagellar biosynthesis protein FlhF